MKLLTLICSLLLAACSYPTNDIPEQVVRWSQENVWLVDTPSGTGSGFWFNDDIFITACHAVHLDDEVAIFRYTDTIFIPMEKVSCNKDNDIAVLKVKWENPLPINRGAEIVKTSQGKLVYGAGYPFGGSLVITSGYWQGAETTISKEDRPETVYATTAPTINGDSGSPVIAIVDGKVVILGIRLAVRVMTQYFGFAAVGTPITHMVLIGGPDSLLQEIGKV